MLCMQCARSGGVPSNPNLPNILYILYICKNDSKFIQTISKHGVPRLRLTSLNKSRPVSWGLAPQELQLQPITFPHRGTESLSVLRAICRPPAMFTSKKHKAMFSTKTKLFSRAWFKPSKLRTVMWIKNDRKPAFGCHVKAKLPEPQAAESCTERIPSSVDCAHRISEAS